MYLVTYHIWTTWVQRRIWQKNSVKWLRLCLAWTIVVKKWQAQGWHKAGAVTRTKDAQEEGNGSACKILRDCCVTRLVMIQRNLWSRVGSNYIIILVKSLSEKTFLDNELQLGRQGQDLAPVAIALCWPTPLLVEETSKAKSKQKVNGWRVVLTCLQLVIENIERFLDEC